MTISDALTAGDRTQDEEPIGWDGRTLAEMLATSEQLFEETGRYHGLEHLELKLRVDVRQQDEGSLAPARRQLRPEGREDVELRIQRLGHVQVGAVAAGPAESPARFDLETIQVDAARAHGRRRSPTRPPPTLVDQ